MKIYVIRVGTYDYDGEDLWDAYENKGEAEAAAKKISAQRNRSARVDPVDLITQNPEKA